MRALIVLSLVFLPWMAGPTSARCGNLAGDSTQDGDAYRVTTRLVLVDAQVLDKKTHIPVNSLQKDDLEVYEDGVQQQISFFSQDELPLSVVLLFDLTDSVRPVLKPLAEGAQRALEHLKPQDEVAVMVYAATAYVVEDFTTDRSRAAAAVARAGRMESREAAFFNEALFKAAEHLSSRSNARRVIIWLTDDVPNIPSDEVRSRYARSLGDYEPHTEKETLEELFRTGTLVCTLLKRSEISDQESARRDSATIIGRMLYPPGEVYKYTRMTGGRVVESSGTKLDKQLADLIDEIRERYSLGYRPSTRKPEGKYCAIKVKLAPEFRRAQKNLIVEAKSGYYR
ncbi:MAG TPA: VWA domain-containing protein [Terriglobales bacterium]